MNVTILITIILFALPLIVAGTVSIILLKKHKKARRSPLARNLLRGPGETLRNDIENLTEKIDDTFFGLFLVAIPPLALILLLSFIGEGKVYVWQLTLTGCLYIGLIFGATRYLYLLLTKRRNLYLGLDAELAVGQELNHLMRDGYYVYHDFPAENFNIDHVAVGPGGVFAIETKGRYKPDLGRGKFDATVSSDGKVLKFPGWEDRKFIEQARRQAVWLKQWLTSAIGEPVDTRPVLALPGWYVDQKERTNVILYSGKNPQGWARAHKRILTENQIKRIKHQLEQRCRDVEPTAYRRGQKKAG